jgi:hypothetical protein
VVHQAAECLQEPAAWAAWAEEWSTNLVNNNWNVD